MTEEQYQGYELSDLEVKRFPNGQHYIGRDIKMGKHWQPYSVNSQAFNQRNQAIRHYSFMKTDQISKRVSNDLGTNNYKGLPERKPIYFNLQHGPEKPVPSYTIDKERSRGSDFKEFYEREYERGAMIPEIKKDDLYVVRQSPSMDLRPIYTVEQLREELEKDLKHNQIQDYIGWEDYSDKEIDDFNLKYNSQFERLKHADLPELKEYMKENHIVLSNVHPNEITGHDLEIENNPLLRDIEKLELPTEREAIDKQSYTLDDVYEPTHEHERAGESEPEHSYENYGDPEPEYEYGFNDIEYEPERDYELKYGELPEQSYEDLQKESKQMVLNNADPQHEIDQPEHIDPAPWEDPDMSKEDLLNKSINISELDPDIQDELNQMDDYIEMCELSVQEFSIER